MPFSCSINWSSGGLEFVTFSILQPLSVHECSAQLNFVMGFRLKLFAFAVFGLLALSFCGAKNVTVKVVGAIHCTDCMRREFSSSQTYLGVDVVIICNSKNRDTKTQGNSAVDKQGKFNVTLSADDGSSMDACLAKLQTASSAGPCPIQTPQTATVELLSTNQNATQASHNTPAVLKFSPLTCQSAFLWPMPNLTFFPTAPPPPPPSDPLPPPDDSILPPAPASEPSNLPQVPSLPPTLSPPAVEIGTPWPAPAPASTPSLPIYSSPPPLPPQAAPPNQPVPLPNPKFKKPVPPPSPKKTLPKPFPPPLPVYNTPPPSPLPQLQPPSVPKFQKPTPILPPIPPKKHKKPQIQTPIAPPIPAVAPPPPVPETPNPPPPLPKHENSAPSPSPSSSPREGKPSIIPRAPPVPRLPPIPQVPRKYFNAPKSKSKPPHSF